MVTTSKTSMANAIKTDRTSTGPRAFKAADDRRARKVHFYTNGKPYLSRLTVSLAPGRDFQTFEQFCAYLSLKSPVLTNGVRYIFTLNGRRITELSELEHDQSYVASSSRHFIAYTYGHNFAPIYGRVPDRARYLAKQEELRMVRPLSSKYNNVYAELDRLSPTPANKTEARVLTVVNNRDHALSAKVIVNLRSPKTFELVLRDLAQAVRLRFPKRMFTAAGQEVRCVSQLKYELEDVDLFYVDSEGFDDHLRLLTDADIDRRGGAGRFHHSMESLPSFTDDLNLLNYYQRAGAYCASNLDLSPARRFGVDYGIFDYDQHHWLQSTGTSRPVRVEAPKSPGRKKASGHQSCTHQATPPEIAPPPPPAMVAPSLTIVPPTPLIVPPSPPTFPSQPPAPPTTLRKSASTSNIASRKSNDRKRKALESETLGQQQQQQQQAISLFSLDTISAEKYEQIQRYAEKLVQEASSQVPNEVAARKRRSLPRRRTPEGLGNRKETTTPKRTPNVPVVRTSPPSSKVTTKAAAAATPAKSAAADDENNSKSKDVEPEIVAKVVAPLTSTAAPSAVAEARPKASSRSVSKPPERLSGSNKRQTKASTRSLSNSRKPTQSVEPLITKTEVRSLHAPKQVRATKANNNNNSRTQPKEKPKTKKVSFEQVDDIEDPSEHLRAGVNVPRQHLSLKRIFGFNGKKLKNLCFVNQRELAFTSGVFVVLWNVQSNRQRFYREHDQDISCMAIEPNSTAMATCQLVAGSKCSLIRIWSAETLETLAVLKDNQSLSQPVIDMQFTLNKGLFVVSASGTVLNINLWSWRNKALLANISKPLDASVEAVLGGTVHPAENDIMVTYGHQHLVVWSHKRETPIDYRTALPLDSELTKSISCADFLSDNSLLTGDTGGKLTIWAPFQLGERLEFAIKEVQGHEAGITCLKLTEDNILISADQDGTIKTWDVQDNQFRLLNALKLPSFSGSITSLAFPANSSANFDIYVGTSESLLLKGSALTTTSYAVLFEGHAMAIRTVSYGAGADDIFYTASLDQKVCKWHTTTGLVWRRQLETQAVSSAVHPSGHILAVGAVNGLVSIIETVAGDTLQHLAISEHCLGCLAYSAEGNFLAAGCQDGNIYVLPVEDDGRAYSKVSALAGPLPVLALQWSMDTQFILTSVDDKNYQELILWDLPNTRYIRNVTKFSDNLTWHDATCSGLEAARGTWDNDQLGGDVVNIACNVGTSGDFIITGDELGLVRLFAHPCRSTQAAFYEYRQGGGSVTAVKIGPNENTALSCSFEGSIHIWKIDTVK